MARTQICAHVKDPIPVCYKRVGLTAGGMEAKTEHTGEEKILGSAVLWQPEFSVHCIGTTTKSNL